MGNDKVAVPTYIFKLLDIINVYAKDKSEQFLELFTLLLEKAKEFIELNKYKGMLRRIENSLKKNNYKFDTSLYLNKIIEFKETVKKKNNKKMKSDKD